MNFFVKNTEMSQMRILTACKEFVFLPTESIVTASYHFYPGR